MRSHDECVLIFIFKKQKMYVHLLPTIILQRLLHRMLITSYFQMYTFFRTPEYVCSTSFHMLVKDKF